jgi:hypothetical protein
MVDPLCHSEISYTMVVNGPRYAGPHFFKKKNGAPDETGARITWSADCGWANQGLLALQAPLGPFRAGARFLLTAPRVKGAPLDGPPMLVSVSVVAAAAAPPPVTYQQCEEYNAYKDRHDDDDNGGDTGRSFHAQQPGVRGAGHVACVCGSRQAEPREPRRKHRRPLLWKKCASRC